MKTRCSKIIQSLTFPQEQISTYDTEIQTDYFGKGNTTSYDRGTTVTVSDPETTFHTYSIDWTSSRIEWLLDGEVIRTLKYADAVSGKNFPQTPMRVRIGIWAGGDPDNSEGTIEWAGGETDYTEGPFSMYIESVNITNYTPAQHYKYTDKTGAYTSIKAYNNTISNSTSSSTKSASLTSKASSSSAGASYSSASASASAITYSGASATMYSSLFATSMVAFIAAYLQL
jgi:beta-glucanase (GH16 family)